ncbi:MAG: oligopeptide transporter, OPT family, partial [Candidatus Eremiobacteraeota bacterium]|nr:oligopeptide transporter, OPT family [Candidatus Eremiobacteraeota bacterium]
WSSIASALFAAIVATNVFAGTVARFARIGAGATGVQIGLQLALIGVGHLVGVTVGVAMLAGLVIAWGILVPIVSAQHAPIADVATTVGTVFRTQVRFIGAGAIGVAALWSLGRLAGPLAGGVASSLAATRARARGDGESLPITERDLPFTTVMLVSVVCLLPLAVLLAVFLAGTPLRAVGVALVLGALVYVVVAGLIVAAICGYMAGLVGSSNSPVSGLAILTVLGASLLLLLVARPGDPNAAKALVAYALFVTAVIINVATISNDNLQDLKTGQLVGATPWRQQVALVAGVLFGAVVIPPILDLLNHAYGFAGSPIKGISAQPLAAPQATLISALANGVISGQLNWSLIGVGALIGLVVVAIDETLRRTANRQFPPLAVALGIYLPMTVTFMIMIGAFLGKLYERSISAIPNPAAGRRLGILTASGLIVGESLFGVLLSGIIVASRKDAPLALVGDAFAPAAEILGILGFIVFVAILYRWTAALARRTP